eukprot:GHVL01008377.1.p1 GENE.GHVL01008377.1~~GHVL01008377.1.p1  ORF type:complete len:702 (+),score=144.42 GHVL01008377.1:54-2159(+)
MKKREDSKKYEDDDHDSDDDITMRCAPADDEKMPYRSIDDEKMPGPSPDSDDESDGGEMPPPDAGGEKDDFEGMPPPPDEMPPPPGGTDSDDDDFGPMPMPIGPSKKRRVLKNEMAIIENLPNQEMYEKSYMHRDTVTHVISNSSTEYIITGSKDGHIKFWKKSFQGIDFVKHFRAHFAELTTMTLSWDGALLSTGGADKAVKLYDVVNFDMTCMHRTTYIPSVITFVHNRDGPTPLIAIATKDENYIIIVKVESVNYILRKFELHQAPPHIILYNEVLDIVISSDKKGAIELWDPRDCKSISKKNNSFFNFELKSETGLFELQKIGTYAICGCISQGTSSGTPDGQLMAFYCEDMHIRIFRLNNCNLIRDYDESLDFYTLAQSDPQQKVLHLERLDFGRRLAVEKELAKSDQLIHTSICFDESSSIIFYPSCVGVKSVNIVTNKLWKILGKSEIGERFLSLSLFQGKAKRKKVTGAVLMQNEKDEKSYKEGMLDPILFATAYKRPRFFLFTKRMPEEFDTGRDIFNEKPSREEAQLIAGVSDGKTARQATIHTTMGDIIVKLFSTETPKTVENFVTHSTNGYYNGIVFHRVIKGFMVQSGDPKGDGTGGESIWGGEFEDEFHRSLKHDRPFTMSMANAGSNTNGSQFFFTTVPCPWLDNKHTVFGRVIQGMNVLLEMEKVATNSQDQPLIDIKILTVKVL